MNEYNCCNISRLNLKNIKGRIFLRNNKFYIKDEVISEYSINIANDMTFYAYYKDYSVIYAPAFKQCKRLFDINNDKDLLFIDLRCTAAKPEIINHLKLTHDKICNYCEIGVRNGATFNAIYNKYPNLQLYAYEINDIYSNALKKLYNNIDNVNIYSGSADICLQTNEIKYDYILFDASHKYEIDKSILLSLIPHLHKNSHLVFDDIEINDVFKLVNEFIHMLDCNIYTINKKKFIVKKIK